MAGEHLCRVSAASRSQNSCWLLAANECMPCTVCLQVMGRGADGLQQAHKTVEEGVLRIMCCIPAAASKAQAAAAVARAGPVKRPAGPGAAAGKDGKVQSYGNHEDSVYSVDLPLLFQSSGLLFVKALLQELPGKHVFWMAGYGHHAECNANAVPYNDGKASPCTVCIV